MKKISKIKKIPFLLLISLLLSMAGCQTEERGTEEAIVSLRSVEEKKTDVSKYEEEQEEIIEIEENVEEIVEEIVEETAEEAEKNIIKTEENSAAQTKPSTEITLSAASIPAYSGKPYAIINDNIPQFLDTDMSEISYEYYSSLDHLGRCGVVYACIGKDLMPTEERGAIGHIKPTGWHTVKYDNVNGKYLYNRCHLIGYQLSGENANTGNLITGTRYMNVDGMLPFENMVADYVQETGNHVMYRVTPVFEGDNFLANGVQIEAKSVEDAGNGILFNVYCYNVQPGISIDYATGESSLEGSTGKSDSENSSENKGNTVTTENVESDSIPKPAPTYNCATCGTSYGSQGEADSCNVSHTPPQEEAKENMVWISETGSKYHSINNCGRMNPDKAYQMSESDAQRNYGKCSKCW